MIESAVSSPVSRAFELAVASEGHIGVSDAEIQQIRKL